MSNESKDMKTVRSDGLPKPRLGSTKEKKSRATPGITLKEKISECVRHAKQGDRDAMATLFEICRDELTAYCTCRLDVESALDIVQEAFLCAMEHIDQLKGGSRFKPWLFTIANNKIKGSYRVNHRRAHSQSEHAKSTQTRKQAMERYQDLVDWEPDPVNRLILHKHYKEFLTFDEIAKSLGMTMNSVKQRASRARKRIFERMKDYDSKYGM